MTAKLRAMNLGILATGLIGAVIGGLIVVVAEQWRWRRENRAALRLLYFEVVTNRIALEEGTAITSLGSVSVWQAQQVRIASALSDADVRKVAVASTAVAGLLTVRASVNSDEAFFKWLKSDRGKEIIGARLKTLLAAEAVLERALVRNKLQGEKRWLGVSGGGLVRL